MINNQLYSNCKNYLRHNSDWLTIVVIYFVLITVSACGKYIRTDGRWWMSIIEKLDLIRPEIFFGLSAMFCFLALRELSRNRFQRKGIVLISFILWFMVALIELTGTSYYFATGDRGFEGTLILYSIQHMKELFPVLASEADRGFGVWVWILMGSVIIITLILKPYKAIDNWSKSTESFGAGRARRRVIVFLVIASIGNASVASLPGLHSQSREYYQSLSFNILLSAWEMAMDVDLSYANPLRDNYPLNSSLKFNDQTKTPTNIVMIILESTRASSLSPYNESLTTTPFMKSLVKESVLYEKVYTMVPHTSKAIIPILCGIEPGLFQNINEGKFKNGIPAKCLASLLREQNYATAFFQTATARFENRTQLVDNFGYEHFVSLKDLEKNGYVKANYFGLEDDAVLPKSMEWLKANLGKPIFATYLTLTPHHDYRAPKRYGRYQFSEDDRFNRYLNSVWYLDNFVKNIINQYKELGLYDNTVFIIVGDHGEGFGEHGRYVHDTVIWNEGIHVPLIIHFAKKRQALRYEKPMSTIDIIPTILSMLDISITGDGYGGVAYQSRELDDPIFSHCWRGRACMAVIQGNMKLIHHFNISNDELYDLETDPDELNNLITKMPELANDMRDKLINWRGAVSTYYSKYYRELNIDKQVLVKNTER